MHRHLLAIVLTGAAVSPFAVAQSFAEYVAPTANSSVFGIAAGPDGALWFTEVNSNKIGRITTSGAVTEFAVPPPKFGGGFPGDITRGPDGAMWFGEVANVGRIDMGGTVTHFPADPGPQGNWIQIGPDGALWYTEWPNHVGRTDISGNHTTLFGIDLDGYIDGLAFGQDGTMWVTVTGSPPDFTSLRRVTPAGAIIAEFTTDAPRAITSGPDGAMWFTTLPGSIGRISTNGAITLFPIPTSDSQPSDIISGPDGALWFTESRANKIGRITTNGVITEYALPSPPAGSSCASNFGPVRITVGPDGALWFTEPCANRIGRFTLTPATPPKTGGVIPAQGSGTSADFTFTFSDASGWQNLGVVNMLINNALDGRKACYLAYAVSSSTLVLVDDAGDAGGPYAGSVTVGNAGTYISNNQCAVSLNSAVGNGSDLTLMLTVHFQPAFGGNVILYLAARDSAQNNSGWQASGVWNAMSQTPAGPIAAVGTVTPARGDVPAGSMEAVTFTVADMKGAADIGIVNLLVNNFIDGRQACYLAYVAATKSLVLVDDAGDAGGPFAGTLQLNGASGTIQNSQCSVSGQGSVVVTNGNQMTLTFAMTFRSPLAGNRVMWVAARDGAGGNNTGWQASGTALITIGN
jgi:virginiamycin B lyase